MAGAETRRLRLMLAGAACALLAGPGLAQPTPPPGPALAVQPPRLESILGSNGSCSTNGPVYTDAAGYNGSADIFEGPTALVLTGSRMQALSDISVVLPNGSRLPALTRTACPGDNLRVTFALPAGARAARLELLANEPPPLVAAPVSPPQACIDRLTGKPTACPTLPPPAPRKVKVASIALNLIARPRVISVAPDSLHGRRTGTCSGGLVFFGSNVGGVRLIANIPGAGFRATVTSQTATSVNATLTRACDPGSVQSALIEPTVLIRRGRSGGLAEIIRCDTCSDGTAATFGGATVRFFGD